MFTGLVMYTLEMLSKVLGEFLLIGCILHRRNVWKLWPNSIVFFLHNYFLLARWTSTRKQTQNLKLLEI